MALCLFALNFSFGVPRSLASTRPEWLQNATIKGFLATYNWASFNHYFSEITQHTTSVGGGLFLGAKIYDGFGFGIEPIYQSGLGLNSNNPDLVSPTLGPTVHALGQAYLQYQANKISATLGNQQLPDAPWNNSLIGYRLLPITYQGLSVVAQPTSALTIHALRMYRWRYYNQSDYNSRTAYTFYLPQAQNSSPGFLAVGMDYSGALGGAGHNIQDKSRAWIYDYYRYAQLYMLQSVNTFGAGGLRKVLGLQWMHASSSDGYLGKVNADLYGIEAGLANGAGKLMLSYDYLPAHANSFNYGGLVTPYDTITASGPIFAQPILFSTQDFGSGEAYGANLDVYKVKNLFAQLRYTYLHMRKSAQYTNYRETNLILSYAVPQVHGLNVSDIFSYGQEKGLSHPNFYQNRLMLAYRF